MSDIGEMVEEFLNDYLEDFVPYSGETQVTDVNSGGGVMPFADWDVNVRSVFSFDGGTDYSRELIDLLKKKFDPSMITAGNNENLKNIQRAFNRDYDYELECVAVAAYSQDNIVGEFDEIIIHMYFLDPEGIYS